MAGTLRPAWILRALEDMRLLVVSCGKALLIDYRHNTWLDLCEIQNPDGTMARGRELLQLAEELDIPLLTIEDIRLYRCVSIFCI